MDRKLTYDDLHLPFYLNTRKVFMNLDVSDLVKAAVLAPVNILLVGDTGTGKTQLAKDIYDYYFGGNKKEGGEGIFIRAHPEIDVYNEVFTEINIEKASRALTKSIESIIYLVDELNRAPVVAQNQFFSLGDGIMDYKGASIKLGRNGYKLFMATANIGNGEFQGTFDTDKALYNRLHVSIDLDYGMYRPTSHDQMAIDMMKADPNVKESGKRNIADLIISASQEIDRRLEDMGLEATAVVNYLRFGLDNCMMNGVKEKIWPLNCQDCEHNKDDKALCSLVRSPVRRTINAMVRYAVALQYLAELKNPDVEVDAVDLMFHSFALTGAYQLLLNPQVLKQDYYDQNPKFMAYAVQRLREDFLANKDYIMSSLHEAEKGRRTVSFFEKKGQIAGFEGLPDELKKKYRKIEPYTNDRKIGLGWMNDLVDFKVSKSKKRKKIW